MLFIDYITLLLANMTAGLVVLAGYLVFGFDHPDRRGWAAPLAAAGFWGFTAHKAYNGHLARYSGEGPPPSATAPPAGGPAATSTALTDR